MSRPPGATPLLVRWFGLASVGTVVLASPASTIAQPESPRAQSATPEVSPERVAIIDLRQPSQSATDREALATSRQAFSRGLAEVPGILVVDDPALVAALAGQGSASRERVAADEGLERARVAADRGDCDAAVAASRDAVLALAARQAAGQAVDAALGQAYVHQLVCAHSSGDADRAMRVRGLLEAIGIDTPPAGINPFIWDLYPAIDATTNSPIVELIIDTSPPGGSVLIDHRDVGTAPVTVYLSQGEHVIAGATRGHAGATRLQVGEPGQSSPPRVALNLVATDREITSKWSTVAQTIIGWRDSKRGMSGRELGRLLGELELRIALVLPGADQVDIWARSSGARHARRIGGGTMGDDPSALAAPVVERVHRWELTGPDPNVELLRETPAERAAAANKGRHPRPWWVYAAIVGAVAIGAGIVLARDLANDKQRIEVIWP